MLLPAPTSFSIPIGDIPNAFLSACHIPTATNIHFSKDLNQAIRLSITKDWD